MEEEGLVEGEFGFGFLLGVWGRLELKGSWEEEVGGWGGGVGGCY